MRALLCGGGTGGHVMPAIAIAEIIGKSFPNSEIAFAGRMGGAENDAYTKTGRTLYTVDISGFSRSLSFKNVQSILKVIKSGITARRIIKDFAPDIIIGTGGYVCYPFIRQGQRLKIKTMIHESNVAPGLVTRLLGPRCDKLLLNLAGTKDHLRKTSNTAVVGNPTRKEFGNLTKEEARRRLGIPKNISLIVSFGGSLGAEVLNCAIFEFLENYVRDNDKVWHIHATGRNHFDKGQKNHPALFEDTGNIRIIPYIEDMPTVLKAADIAITRSGAMTVSELSVSGTPSILIPSPNVAANHQYYNAKYMQSKGGAVLIEERDLSADKLRSEVVRLISSKQLIRKMSLNAKETAKTNTNRLITNSIKEIIDN